MSLEMKSLIEPALLESLLEVRSILCALTGATVGEKGLNRLCQRSHSGREGVKQLSYIQSNQTEIKSCHGFTVSACMYITLTCRSNSLH